MVRQMDGTRSPDTDVFPPPRYVGRINWLGLWTHYAKEVHRFVKVGLQTLVAPCVTTLLFLAIFSLALGRAVPNLGGVSFAEFLAPGLIIFAIIQNSFANTTSSIMIAKIQGNIVDLLMPPLTAAELTLGFALAGVTRGVMVALAVGLAMWAFVPLGLHDPLMIAFHAVSAAIMLSVLGMIVAIWADKFDNVASITNFIITPLSFLSGTFYSIERLPGFWRDVAAANPFFYLIDGFRYGFIGHHDGSLVTGMIVVTAINIVLWSICHVMIVRGYKIKT